MLNTLLNDNLVAQRIIDLFQKHIVFPFGDHEFNNEMQSYENICKWPHGPFEDRITLAATTLVPPLFEQTRGIINLLVLFNCNSSIIIDEISIT